MNSIFYPIYQAAGWLLLYTGLIVALYMRPWFSPFEYIYAAALVGSAAVYSHIMRSGFKRWLDGKHFVWQLLYFILQSSIGGAFAGLMLFVCVFLLSSAGITDPIAIGQEAFIFKMVFWANAFNMIAALLLWSAFYLTITKARQLRDVNQALASSQLDALIQQLSPHFLFNVLNNIRALILDDPAKARESLTQLADMLRYSLQTHENSKVTLAEELAVVEEYLSLCKIQFEQRLSFRAHIEPAAEQALMPKMLLQLCVENAIKHGIGKIPAGGEISLEVRIIDQQLQLLLYNPCPRQAEQGEQAVTTGVGLRNIQQRLKLLYNSPFKPTVSFQRRVGASQAQDEVQVSIKLPLEYATHGNLSCE